MNILKKVFGNKYNGISMIDAGGVYFLENIKTYGEDDPSIGKALRFETSRKKRSPSQLRMIPQEKHDDGHHEAEVYVVDKKKSSDL